ncbi:ExbD/TolR family protein [Erythrobacter sp. F6033]|uniref:ExbD/TolR family protein n=1 Tax=Erythrobacter sp. F6033 TaxID=2926401 RepID=UPI001FF3D06B|nr:ExbD/TolR family protein [Erythrobacter sp. F6033]MCK0127488.1 ExbD/TolR family protein [Erythrobacter sp. F6033]
MGMGLASSRSGRRSRRAPMSEINVTPFVDVMLVLLIIFMVTAPLLAVGVPIELPDSRANAVEQTPEQITISVDSDGVIYIDSEAVPTGGFPAALAAIDRQANGELPIIVFRGDRAVEYGRTMAVLGELNRAGFTNISLVTSGSVSPP